MVVSGWLIIRLHHPKQFLNIVNPWLKIRQNFMIPEGTIFGWAVSKELKSPLKNWKLMPFLI